MVLETGTVTGTMETGVPRIANTSANLVNDGKTVKASEGSSQEAVPSTPSSASRPLQVKCKWGFKSLFNVLSRTIKVKVLKRKRVNDTRLMIKG